MNANKLLFCTVTSLLSVQALSPDLLLSGHRSLLQRGPASATYNFSKIDGPKKIEQEEAKTAEPAVVCKPEPKGEQLQLEMEKLLKDKEQVLAEMNLLKKENGELKNILSSSEESKKEKEIKPSSEQRESRKITKSKKEKIEDESGNYEQFNFILHLTTMFSAEMKTQMQSQIDRQDQMMSQMMSMFSQMHSEIVSKITPYSPPLPNMNQGYPTLSDRLSLLGSQVGINAQPSPWGSYAEPYSMIPELNRQRLLGPADLGFSFNQVPSLRGFDFNQQNPYSLERSMMPSQPMQPIQPMEQSPSLPAVTII